MEALIERLRALLRENVIAGFQPPHENVGLAKGMLPWVIFPFNGGPSSTHYTLDDLERHISVLEDFGPVNFVLGGGNMCRYSHGACEA